MSSSTSNSEPLSLLLRTLLFGVPLGVLLLLATLFGPHASPVDYMGAVAMKHARLEALGSPKVVIIGGSNATFGIDSEKLEKAICRPVVNMTIHAGLGFRFMVEEVMEEIGPGDLVIAALEHSSYSSPVKDNDMHILTVDRYPNALHFIPWTARPRIVLGVAVMRSQAVWKVWNGDWKDDSLEPVYRANGFNQHGDLISHLDKPQRDPASQERTTYKERTIDPGFWPIAQRLSDRVTSQGGRLVFILPAIARSSHRPDVDRHIVEALTTHGFTVLGAPDGHVRPDTAFYDTHYHLRAEGRQQRTMTLINDLSNSGVVDPCVGIPGMN